MQSVFVLSVGEAHEGVNILGVYLNEQLAIEAEKTWIAQNKSNKYPW